MLFKLSVLVLTFFVATACSNAKEPNAREHRQAHKKERVSSTPSQVGQEAAISPQDYANKLGRGLDVDWSKTGKGMQSYSTKMTQDFKQLGLGHVRIRVANDVSEDLLNTLERQIDDVLAVGMMPVLAYQADAFKNKPEAAELEKAVQWWAKVAQRFQKKSYQLSFDQIIEVTDALNKAPDMLNQYHARVTQVIRQSNPKRIVFISPRLRSDPAYLKELKIPSQHNGFLMAEWHFYASGPSKKNANKLWTKGTEAEKALIRNKINVAKLWTKQTGVQTWVGAWMPGNYNDGNDYSVKEQVEFANFVACELDKAAVPFAVNSDTKFYDASKQQWIEPMLPVVKAFLFPSNCK